MCLRLPASLTYYILSMFLYDLIRGLSDSILEPRQVRLFDVATASVVVEILEREEITLVV